MRNKKVLIIVLIIVAVLILGVGGFVFAYTTTDILKSDKKLFYKYLLENTTKIENLGSQELTNYLDRQKSTPYAEEGKLTVKASLPGMEEDYANVMTNVNNLNVTFIGKADPVNNKNEKSFQLNYNDNISFPLEFKQEGNLYGIKSSLIVKQYLAIKNENLDEFFEKFGIDGTQIDELLSTSQNNINEEQITNVLNEIYKAIETRLTDANFSKLENVGYTLSLTEQEVLNILIDSLTILQNSNIINQEQKQSLESGISELQNIQVDSTQIIKVNVYKAGNISIVLPDNQTITMEIRDNSISIYPMEDRSTYITLQKSMVENMIGYNLECATNDIEGINGKIYFELVYSGLNGTTVNEKYKFGVSSKYNDEEMLYEYNVNSNKTFGNSIDIEPMGEDSVILNDAEEEYIGKLMEAIGQRIVEINNEQMEALGVPQDQHPLIYATPVGYIIYNMNNMMNQTLDENDNSGGLQFEENNNNVMNNLETSMTSAAMQSFNSQFSAYEGIGSAANVKSLIQMVISNNVAQEAHKVSVNGITNSSELTEYGDQISSEKTYTITMEKDAETGYITNISVN